MHEHLQFRCDKKAITARTGAAVVRQMRKVRNLSAG